LKFVNVGDEPNLLN